MELYEKQLASKQIFDGKVVKLFVDDIELPNGKGAFREVVRHPGAVCVIPITDEGEVIMVKQFRYPFSSVLLEIPAGKLEIGEDPLDAVKRELEEESGVVAENLLMRKSIPIWQQDFPIRKLTLTRTSFWRL